MDKEIKFKLNQVTISWIIGTVIVAVFLYVTFSKLQQEREAEQAKAAFKALETEMIKAGNEAADKFETDFKQQAFRNCIGYISEQSNTVPELERSAWLQREYKNCEAMTGGHQ